MSTNFNVNVAEETKRYNDAMEDIGILSKMWKIPQEQIDYMFKITEESLENDLTYLKSPLAIFDAISNLSGVYNLREAYRLLENTDRGYAKNANHDMVRVFLELVAQAVSANYLIDNVSKWDLKEQNRKEGLIRANNRFLHNHTSSRIRWGWNIYLNDEMTIGHKEITEKKVHYNNCYMNKYGKTINVGINPNWKENVEDKGLASVELTGNKSALVLHLEEIPNHELISENVKLFNAKICYMYCPMKEVVKEIDKVIVEDKIIAAQYNYSNKPEVVATGKNKDWAIRTMKGRLKKDLFAQLDI